MARATLGVPGGDRKWDPEELATEMDTKVFGTRHFGLRGGLGSLRPM